MEEKKDQKVEINYEIKMYQLLILFIVSIFVAIGIGVWVGHSIGYSQGIDDVKVTTPDYCHAENVGHANINIICNEMENTTLADLCTYLSTPLEHKIRILITG